MEDFDKDRKEVVHAVAQLLDVGVLVGGPFVAIDSEALKNLATREVVLFADRLHDELLEVAGEEEETIFVGQHHHRLGATAFGEMMPCQRELSGRVARGVRLARELVHGFRTSEESIDVEALQSSGEEPNGAEFARAAAHPIPHREAGEPLLGASNFIELATFAGDRDRVGRKRKARLLPTQGGFNLAVPWFRRAARLRSHQDEGGAEALTKRIKDAVDAVGIRVVDEVHAQGVLRGAEGIGHKLRA